MVAKFVELNLIFFKSLRHLEQLNPGLQILSTAETPLSKPVFLLRTHLFFLCDDRIFLPSSFRLGGNCATFNHCHNN